MELPHPSPFLYSSAARMAVCRAIKAANKSRGLALPARPAFLLLNSVRSSSLPFIGVSLSALRSPLGTKAIVMSRTRSYINRGPPIRASCAYYSRPKEFPIPLPPLLHVPRIPHLCWGFIMGPPSSTALSRP